MAIVGTVDFTSTLKKLDKITDETKVAIGGALFLGGAKIEENAKISIQREPKTGVIYQRGNVAHRASAAGEAPANDTGALVRSFNLSASSDKMVVSVKSGTGVVDYAKHLEYGTDKMEARPFMKPALEKSRKYINERMEKAIKKVVAKNAE
jgi:HK97 gp10 family phage protein